LRVQRQAGRADDRTVLVHPVLERCCLGAQIAHGVAPSVAATDGYALVFRIGAVLLVIGGVLVLALLERGVSTEMRQPGAEELPEPAAAPA